MMVVAAAGPSSTSSVAQRTRLSAMQPVRGPPPGRASNRCSGCSWRPVACEAVSHVSDVTSDMASSSSEAALRCRQPQLG